LRDASDIILAHGDGRIKPTGKNRSGRRSHGRRGRSKLQQLKQEELEHVFNEAFLDREQAEVVSLTESRLLDVDRGEVLRNSRYIRAFNL